ncbi:MAG: GxxExxY protein [Parcubacteria group bacterium]|nr:GxxExxY protein [Parcubacteria group bacterium]
MCSKKLKDILQISYKDKHTNIRITCRQAGTNLQMITNNTTLEKIIYPELSYTLTGILFSVHNELSQYAKEKQYGDLVETKLKESKITYNRETRIADSGNILDFIIDGKITLELKSIRMLTKDSYRQTQNYLQQTGHKLGILVNFRPKYLKPVRIIRIDSYNS